MGSVDRGRHPGRSAGSAQRGRRRGLSSGARNASAPGGLGSHAGRAGGESSGSGVGTSARRRDRRRSRHSVPRTDTFCHWHSLEAQNGALGLVSHRNRGAADSSPSSPTPHQGQWGHPGRSRWQRVAALPRALAAHPAARPRTHAERPGRADPGVAGGPSGPALPGVTRPAFRSPGGSELGPPREPGADPSRTGAQGPSSRAVLRPRSAPASAAIDGLRIDRGTHSPTPFSPRTSLPLPPLSQRAR